MIVRGRCRRGLRALGQGRDGTSAIEFAILFPLFLLVVLGIMVFGLYFGTALSIQQIAANAARAAVAGLDDSERMALARAEVSSSVGHYLLLQEERLAIAAAAAADDADLFVVTLSYDASDLPIFGLDELIPTPPPTIVRTAAIRRGGL